MSLAIDFDRQPGWRAVEVENIWPGSMLLAKPKAGGIAAKRKPQRDLGRGHRPA
jgi:hypothetical protein